MTTANSRCRHRARSRRKASGHFSLAGWMAANIWAIVILVAVMAASLTIVRMFKKPGQMSVIEAQSMDMWTIKPPPGAVPVEITKAQRESIEGTVTYTGTVQAYEDEDVYARVTGRIVQMLVYPGDLVRKGQLLVVLDNQQNSEYEARLRAAVEARNAAMHKAGVSKQEFKQKQYLYNAAIDAEDEAARALEEAQADLSYWSPEIKRQEALLKQQVVSQQEYDAELAKFRAAQAKVAKARARLSQARNEKIAAEAAFEAEVHHIGHAFSEARQAEAALKEAGVIEAYTRILARDEGVVTKRLISPGVVVNPGMPILKVAHIAKVRVQAEVAGADLEKVHLGSPVSIRLSAASQRAINAMVTSIFPAADPTSRTSTVEALVDNIEPVGASPTSTARSGKRERTSTAQMYRLLPGQYVVVTISTGARTGITVPTRAVIWREGRPQVWKVVRGGQTSGPVDYTCLMHPEVHSDKPGKCPQCGMDLQPSKKNGAATVALQDISIGVTNADKTEVTSGLCQADEVVSAGYADLQPGQAVVGAQWGNTGPVSLPTAAEVAGNRLGQENNWTMEKIIDHLMVKVTTAPAPPRRGDNTIVVSLSRHGGGAVAGANVSASTSMPAMGMSGPVLSAAQGPAGTYKLKGRFASGLWRIDLAIQAPGTEPGTLALDFEVP